MPASQLLKVRCRDDCWNLRGSNPVNIPRRKRRLGGPKGPTTTTATQDNFGYGLTDSVGWILCVSTFVVGLFAQPCN